MSAAREQETISIESKFVTEIILYIFTIGILHEKVLISLGHRMILRDMGNHMDAIIYLAGLAYHNEPVIVYLWPLRSNAMQISSFGVELSAHCIRRYDDLSLSIMPQEIL